jgi:hypothetical protein
MESLRDFIYSDRDKLHIVGRSGRCRYMVHKTCDRLGLEHATYETRRRCEITREWYNEQTLQVSRPLGWSMGDRSFDDFREDCHPTGDDAPRPHRKRYECECCGKGDNEVQIALTRRWGLACVDCIEDGSMSEMVGEDVTAYKIEDVPRDYFQRGVTGRYGG